MKLVRLPGAILSEVLSYCLTLVKEDLDPVFGVLGRH